MIVYKLMKIRKNGTLGSLFINAKQAYPIGTWIEAENHPTKGYAQRYGWHCTLEPVAPHLSIKGRVGFGLRLKLMILQYLEDQKIRVENGYW